MMEWRDEGVDAWLEGKAELHQLLGIDAEAMEQLRGRAQHYLDEGEWEQALVMLEMLEALDRRDVRPTLFAIDALLELGRSDAAEAKLQRWVTAPVAPLVQVAQAQIAAAAGDLARAAILLHGVIAADPAARTEAGKRARWVVAEVSRRTACG